MCEMCDGFVNAAPATPPPADAPTLAEVVAGADPFAGSPWEALAEIELHDPGKRIGSEPDPIASLCLHSSPWVGLVCCRPAGHDGEHRSNPIPAMEWPR